MKSYSFTIGDPVMAYVRVHTRRSAFGNPRVKRYNAYKSRVRLEADKARVPVDLGKDDQVSVKIIVSWKKRARADLDSIVKSTLDSLWKQDRRVLNIRAESWENAGCERCEVSMEIVSGGNEC